MQVDRRAFLMCGTAAAAGLAMAPRSFAADIPAPEKEAVLNLCSQLGVIPGQSLDEKLAKLQAWGCTVVELGGDVVGNEKMYLDAIAKTDLKLSAVCWGSHNGDLVAEDAQRRKKGVEAQWQENVGQQDDPKRKQRNLLRSRHSGNPLVSGGRSSFGKSSP